MCCNYAPREPPTRGRMKRRVMPEPARWRPFTLGKRSRHGRGSFTSAPAGTTFNSLLITSRDASQSRPDPRPNLASTVDVLSQANNLKLPRRKFLRSIPKGDTVHPAATAHPHLGLSAPFGCRIFPAVPSGPGISRDDKIRDFRLARHHCG